jgi:hypothetical protein
LALIEQPLRFAIGISAVTRSKLGLSCTNFSFAADEETTP